MAMTLLPRIGRGDGPMLGICVGHAMTHWYPGAFVVMLPFFASDLGLSLTEVGILVGLRSITSTLINLPGGMIVDVVGQRKLVMVLAIAWAGLPYLFLGLTSNFLIIAAFMAIVGVGNLLYHPAGLRYSDALTRREHRRYPGAGRCGGGVDLDHLARAVDRQRDPRSGHVGD